MRKQAFFMRFLIVDDSRESRQVLAAMLHARWPTAQVQNWDPREDGSPRAELGRKHYDAVILNWQAAAPDGSDWLAEFDGQSSQVPMLLIAERGAEEFAGGTAKRTATRILRKSELNFSRLVQALKELLRESDPAGASFSASRPGAVARSAPGSSPPAPPIAGYQILGIIGQGGMAQVYLAERESDRLRLVLKVLDPSLRADTTYVKRLEREYRLLASVHNEHVARVYDQDFGGAHPYIAMEFLSGGSLATRIHDGLSSREALRITSQIAKALDAVHSQGIVHRDLKPQNILFRENGGLAIVDFGLAKNLTADLTLTRHGQLLATPRYASPEQCLGHPSDLRSDLYSVGVMFYEMLSGSKIFQEEARGPAEVVYMHVHGETPRLPARLAGYQTILDRLLAKNPDDRFQSARELFAKIAV
jgi:DNA-binding response OmpR family regulator